MKTRIVPWITLGLGLLALASLQACAEADGNAGQPVATDQNAFNDYWYAGKAEITRYALQQARYGELRNGDAVLIFVTEPFLKDKQVKYEFGDDAQAVSVLKLNFVRKFYTGIYPYSMMSSIFTPVDWQTLPTLKVTTSAQEWCGHVFLQLNRRDDGYRVQLRSYFQREGDRDFQVGAALLEDEIWTRIRLAPKSLPTGEIAIIPGTQFQRFKHIPLKVEKATATRRDEGDVQVYAVDYPRLERKLTIRFERAFPHRILEWNETYLDGFGNRARMLTTRAVKTHSLRIDYWTKNKLSDSHLREELGLMY